MKRLLIFVLLSPLYACTATRIVDVVEQRYVAPDIASFERSRVFSNATYDEVWEAVMSFFAAHQIAIDTIEKDSRIVVAKKMLSGASQSETYASLGTLVSKTSRSKQWLKPSQLEGSAWASVVRRTGKVTRTEPIADTQQEYQAPAVYRVAVSFNVFVERFNTGDVRATMNTVMEPLDKVSAYRGWYWFGDDGQDTKKSAYEILARITPHVSATSLNPTPTTTGELEAAFLDYVEGRMSDY